MKINQEAGDGPFLKKLTFTFVILFLFSLVSSSPFNLHFVTHQSAGFESGTSF